MLFNCRKLACLFLILSLVGAIPAAAETRVLQPGIADGNDTFVNSGYPDTAWGGVTYLNFGGHLPEGEQWCLIRFDMATIDPSSSITTAQLDVFMYSQNGFVDSFNYGLMRATSSWSEGSVTWTTRPTYDPEPITVFSGNDWQAQYGIWHTIDGLGGLAQFWIDNPDQNFGLLIKPIAGSYGYPNLWSSEYADASLRPKLILDGAIVPTESSSWGEVKLLY